MGATMSKLKSVKICSIFVFMQYLNLFNFTGKALGNGNMKKLGLEKLVSDVGEKMDVLSILPCYIRAFHERKKK